MPSFRNVSASKSFMLIFFFLGRNFPSAPRSNTGDLARSVRSKFLPFIILFHSHINISNFFKHLLITFIKLKKKIIQLIAFYDFSEFLTQYFKKRFVLILNKVKKNLYLHSHLVCLQYFQNQQMCYLLHLQIIVCIFYTNIH